VNYTNYANYANYASVVSNTLCEFPEIPSGSTNAAGFGCASRMPSRTGEAPLSSSPKPPSQSPSTAACALRPNTKGLSCPTTRSLAPQPPAAHSTSLRPASRLRPRPLASPPSLLKQSLSLLVSLSPRLLLKLSSYINPWSLSYLLPPSLIRATTTKDSRPTTHTPTKQLLPPLPCPTSRTTLASLLWQTPSRENSRSFESSTLSSLFTVHTLPFSSFLSFR